MTPPTEQWPLLDQLIAGLAAIVLLAFVTVQIRRDLRRERHGPLDR
jgi:hypothetical protein